MILLTIALFFDAIVNIGRIIEVERGLKMQAEWLKNRDAEVARVIAALAGEDKQNPFYKPQQPSEGHGV
jgi:hypothetical protein